MTGRARLEAHTTELNAAMKTLTRHCRNIEATSDVEVEAGNAPQPLVPPEAPVEVHRARRPIMANIAKLQTLLAEPADFLQELARQIQLLTCIHWLGEFRVLACIPLQGSVPFKDVAELVGVPDTQLRRIVRMTATAGFLHEPRPAHVAHSALSAPFVTRPSYLDAAMFLSETAAPAALHMAAATHRFGQSPRPHESAYNVALGTSVPFASMCEQRSTLQRQWPAYLPHAMGDVELSVTDLLTCFDWLSLGNATVVEVGARSTATALAMADLYPALHLIVQMSEPRSATNQLSWESTSSRWDLATPVPQNRTTGSQGKPGEIPSQLSSRLTIQNRIQGTLQSVDGAAVYILRLPSPSPTIPPRSLSPQLTAELKAHLGVLRASNTSRLILTARLLPETGIVDAEVACLRDLSLLQLANDHELEMLEFMNILNSVGDSIGRLILVNQLRAWNNATVAFEIRYQAYADSHEL